METDDRLYSPGDIRRLEKKKQYTAAALRVFAGALIVLCAGLAMLTTTATAAATERAVMLISGAGGCLWLYLRRFLLSETGHELSHARMLSEETGETLHGLLTVTEERMHIRGSITFRTVLLSGDGGERRLKVIESRAGALKALEGRTAKVRVVNGYVAGVRGL